MKFDLGRATLLDDWCVVLSFFVLFPSMFFGFLTQDMWANKSDSLHWTGWVSPIGFLSMSTILFILWCVQGVYRYFNRSIQQEQKT